MAAWAFLYISSIWKMDNDSILCPKKNTDFGFHNVHTHKNRFDYYHLADFSALNYSKNQYVQIVATTSMMKCFIRAPHRSFPTPKSCSHFTSWSSSAKIAQHTKLSWQMCCANVLCWDVQRHKFAVIDVRFVSQQLSLRKWHEITLELNLKPLSHILKIINTLSLGLECSS